MRIAATLRAAALLVTLALVGAGPMPARATAPPVPAGPLTNRYYSLESSNYPGHFARHRNYLGELTTVSSNLDRLDATWMVVPGLAGSGVSLRSRNFPS
jgi:hypothetical protein